MTATPVVVLRRYRGPLIMILPSSMRIGLLVSCPSFATGEGASLLLAGLRAIGGTLATVIIGLIGDFVGLGNRSAGNRQADSAEQIRAKCV